jgi:hypothetical protein
MSALDHDVDPLEMNYILYGISKLLGHPLLDLQSTGIHIFQATDF